jgi:hypothetical protein
MEIPLEPVLNIHVGSRHRKGFPISREVPTLVWPASQPTLPGTKKSSPPQLILAVILFLREMCNLTEFSVFEN